MAAIVVLRLVHVRARSGTSGMHATSPTVHGFQVADRELSGQGTHPPLSHEDG